MILALDEACANVIRHAFPDGSNGCFRLVAEITDVDIRMAVEDDGVGFAPEELDLRDDGAASDEGFAEAFDPDAAPATSGRGLEIIRHVMTSVEVRSPTESGVGTRLSMTKRLREPV